MFKNNSFLRKKQKKNLWKIKTEKVMTIFLKCAY